MKIHRLIPHYLMLAAGGMLLLGAMITGCATEPNPPEPLIHTPGSGSAYRFTNYAKDTTGTNIQSSETHSTRTIIATNATILGQGGVVQFREQNDTSTGTTADTVSMHYEGNGDVKLFQPAVSFPNADFPAPPGIPLPNLTIPARWVTFGFGSKTQMTVPSYDTTVNLTLSGFPISLNVKATGTTSYIGTEDVMVGAEKIATQKGLLTVNVQFAAALLFNGSITTTDTVWFAPKLGMFVKDDAISRSVLPAQFGPSGIMGGSYSVLTSYTMK